MGVGQLVWAALSQAQLNVAKSGLGRDLEKDVDHRRSLDAPFATLAAPQSTQLRV